MVGADLAVDDLFNDTDLFNRHGLAVRKIEACALRVDQRPLLLHVMAQHLAQCRVQQVGGRMVPLRAMARADVHVRQHGIANGEPSCRLHAMVPEHIGLHLLRVAHPESACLGGQFADIADLSAGLRVERRTIQHHDALLSGLEEWRRGALLVQRDDPGVLDTQGVVALEFGLGTVVFDAGRHLETRGRARLGTLPVHGGFIALHVDRLAALTGHVGSQVNRETIGVVQREHRVTVDDIALLIECDIENLHAMFQRLGKAQFFGLQRSGHFALRRGQFRIGHAHRRAKVLHQLVEERLVLAQLVSVPQCTTDDPAQHITSAVIRGNDAVHDQEGCRPDVVRDDLEGRIGQISGSRFTGSCGNEALEQVDLVIGMHVLQYRRDALQAHAGVDTGLGQRREHALVVAVVLHEHEVPDFDVAIAIRVRGSRGAARHLGAVIEEDLRAGSARTGIGHLPEIVGSTAGLVADTHDAIDRHADFLRPHVERFVVGLVHRHPQFFLGQPIHVGQQFPRIVDGIPFEVIAEREIAEHFEERVMPRRVTDVFQVIVLAAGANAALRRRGATIGFLFLAQEHVLELHHARIGEQQRRVVARNQGTRRHNGVSLGLEILQEALADLSGFHGAVSW